MTRIDEYTSREAEAIIIIEEYLCTIQILGLIKKSI